MSAQSEPVTYAAGEYLVTRRRVGQGIDYYFEVVGPDGRTTEEKVYWMYSMTPAEVAEAAVAGHVGHGAPRRAAATRQHENGGYVVTLDEAD